MTEYKRAKNKLDKVFSEYIRKRDKYTCFTCGIQSKEKAQCGHLFSRISTATRWDEINSKCQCAGCNCKHEFDFEIYRRRFVDLHGEKVYNNLYKKFKSTVKLKTYELLELVNAYQEKIKELDKQDK